MCPCVNEIADEERLRVRDPFLIPMPIFFLETPTNECLNGFYVMSHRSLIDQVIMNECEQMDQLNSDKSIPRSGGACSTRGFKCQQRNVRAHTFSVFRQKFDMAERFIKKRILHERKPG